MDGSMESLCKTLDWVINADVDELKNKQILSQKIGEAGLVCDLRPSPQNPALSLYGDDVQYRIKIPNIPFIVENWFEYRTELECGGLWQTPVQLAGYLIFLSDKSITSFLEIGTFTGYTTIIVCAYLSRFGLTRFDTYDISHLCKIEFLISKYSLPITYKVGTPDFIKTSVSSYYDTVFIDGDHGYDGVKADFIKFGKGCRFVCFHDINDFWCSGVVKFWNELKTTYYGSQCLFHEFIDHPNNFKLMGIGVMEWGTQLIPTPIQPKRKFFWNVRV
uniref:Methyltransferase n=1 Tax=viral metagenome TaxID=1070528 RepID=A0A6C0AIT5_9ZZZZ